jgi:hypothetical protein
LECAIWRHGRPSWLSTARQAHPSHGKRRDDAGCDLNRNDNKPVSQEQSENLTSGRTENAIRTPMSCLRSVPSARDI